MYEVYFSFFNVLYCTRYCTLAVYLITIVIWYKGDCRHFKGPISDLSRPPQGAAEDSLSSVRYHDSDPPYLYRIFQARNTHRSTGCCWHASGSLLNDKVPLYAVAFGNGAVTSGHLWGWFGSCPHGRGHRLTCTHPLCKQRIETPLEPHITILWLYTGYKGWKSRIGPLRKATMMYSICFIGARPLCSNACLKTQTRISVAFTVNQPSCGCIISVYVAL